MLSSFRIVINTELVTLLSPFHSYEESSPRVLRETTLLV